MLLHEAVGHGLESDFNRRETSLYSGRVGERVANELVTISGLKPFTEVSFSSTKDAFEFSIVPPTTTTTGATPEPGTWAMMMLGFAGLGYAAFRRNTKGRALAI